MKKGLIVLGVILLMVVGLVGCESGVSPPSITGTYVLQVGENYDKYLELKRDGTFSIYARIQSEGEEYELGECYGQWKVKGDELKLWRESCNGEILIGQTLTAEIWADKIIDEWGDVWVKQ